MIFEAQETLQDSDHMNYQVFFTCLLRCLVTYYL